MGRGSNGVENVPCRWKPAAATVLPSGEKATARSPASAITRSRVPDFASYRRTPSAAVATSDPSGETATEFTETAGGAWRARTRLSETGSAPGDRPPRKATARANDRERLL